MISWGRFWKEGKHKSIVYIFCGAIFSILSSLFVLNDIAWSAKPWAWPEPMAICKHIDLEVFSINKDDPPPIPDPDTGHGSTLSTPSGDNRQIAPRAVAASEEAVGRENMSLPWVIWFDFLLTLLN